MKLDSREACTRVGLECFMAVLGRRKVSQVPIVSTKGRSEVCPQVPISGHRFHGAISQCTVSGPIWADVCWAGRVKGSGQSGCPMEEGGRQKRS